ncbi:MAG: hypothetical protein LBR08_05400 [Bacteroidales bacterium]|jgi:16S rRNA processing protein RimM|nr:hypothetical protein [Bacteroidales bacterium]
MKREITGDHRLQPLGKFSKTHGYSGMMILACEDALDDAAEELKELFVMIDGLPVPFPVEELLLQGGKTAHVKLEFVCSPDDAAELTGCEVYADLPRRTRKASPDTEQYAGFSVRDMRHGDVGAVVRTDNYNGNTVMQVDRDGKEMLFSLSPELIADVDETNRILYINAPDGYF